MEKIFTDNQGREVLIKKEDGYACFYNYQNYLHQKEWVEKETARRFEFGEDPLQEDEMRNDNF